MVTEKSTDNDGDGRENRPSPLRYTKIFEEECGYYLSIGMTYLDYWDGDSTMVKYYRDKHKRELERQNFNHWMQGLYFYEALIDASPVFNPLSEKHEPYPYSRVSREHDDESLRDVDLVSTSVDNWDSYDTVFIGYPIWWGIAAWPVDGFVEANDFTGKAVIPFCTAASSGIGDSGNLLEEMAGTGNWLEGKRLDRGISEDEVKDWISDLGISSVEN